MRKPRSPRPTSCTRIASHVTGLRAGVRDLDPPQPELVLRVQPQRDAVPHAAGRAVPGEAIGGGAEADLRAGADRLRDRRLGRADAQVQAGDPAVERRALHLVDQRSAALVLVLDGEDAAVGQDADRQAGRVRDAAQAEIAFAGRLEACGRQAASSVISRLRPIAASGAPRWQPARRYRRLKSLPCQPPLATALAASGADENTNGLAGLSERRISQSGYHRPGRGPAQKNISRAVHGGRLSARSW